MRGRRNLSARAPTPQPPSPDESSHREDDRAMRQRDGKKEHERPLG